MNWSACRVQLAAKSVTTIRLQPAEQLLTSRSRASESTYRLVKDDERPTIAAVAAAAAGISSYNMFARQQKTPRRYWRCWRHNLQAKWPVTQGRHLGRAGLTALPQTSQLELTGPTSKGKGVTEKERKSGQEAIGERRKGKRRWRKWDPANNCWTDAAPL